MNEIKSLHREAMSLASQAVVAEGIGDELQSEVLFRRAFELEREAADLIAANMSAEPTRSILQRSAGYLALRAGKTDIAEKLAARGLAGDPPEDIREELHVLMEKATFERHLCHAGIQLSQRHIHVSLIGRAIGHGVARPMPVWSRVSAMGKLLQRTAERKLGFEFRERGSARKIARDVSQVFISPPSEGSFAFTLTVGKPTEQMDLFQDKSDRGLTDCEVVDDLIGCLGLFSRGSVDDLKAAFGGVSPYYVNFVALAKELSPDGRDVTMVGLASQGHDGIDTRLKLFPCTSTDWGVDDGEGDKVERVVITGEIRYADEIKKNRVVVVDEQKIGHSVQVPLGWMKDIVKPLWGETVVVSGFRSEDGKSMVLSSINKAEDADE